jgi:2-(1,2-epoxy-1,2-dihydrophenyl)acetyl-CoA isomerase
VDVELSREGAVLTIALNRPQVLNALNRELHEALLGALREARAPDVRAVVLTGNGCGFCVGQDLAEVRDPASADIGERLRRHYHRNVLALRGLEKPVLAAVNGAAAGAGISLACACDLRIASSDARFVPAFVSIGLVPDSGASWFLSRLLGPARAFEWMTSARALPAQEALEWGLVSEVLEPERLAGRAAELAATLAELPTAAVARTKRLFEAAPASTLEEQLELEAQLQVASVATEDYGEGVTAFLEKRQPRFRGR